MPALAAATALDDAHVADGVRSSTRTKARRAAEVPTERQADDISNAQRATTQATGKPLAQRVAHGKFSPEALTLHAVNDDAQRLEAEILNREPVKMRMPGGDARPTPYIPITVKIPGEGGATSSPEQTSVPGRRCVGVGLVICGHQSAAVMVSEYLAFAALLLTCVLLALRRLLRSLGRLWRWCMQSRPNAGERPSNGSAPSQRAPPTVCHISRQVWIGGASLAVGVLAYNRFGRGQFGLMLNAFSLCLLSSGAMAVMRPLTSLTSTNHLRSVCKGMLVGGSAGPSLTIEQGVEAYRLYMPQHVALLVIMSASSVVAST